MSEINEMLVMAMWFFIFALMFATYVLMPASTLCCLYSFCFKRPWKKGALLVTGIIYVITGMMYLLLYYFI